MPPRGRKPSLTVIQGGADGDSDQLDVLEELHSHPGKCGQLKDDGAPCMLSAGWGTDHKGEGPCKYHSEDPRRVQGCPVALSKRAAAIWEDIAPELKSRGLLKRAFWPALAGLCTALANMIEAALIVEREGIMVSAYRGDRKKNPALQVFRDSAHQVRLYCAEFGMTPAALAKFGDQGVEAELDEMEKLIAGTF